MIGSFDSLSLPILHLQILLDHSKKFHQVYCDTSLSLIKFATIRHSCENHHIMASSDMTALLDVSRLKTSSYSQHEEETTIL
jgi:hypothetical protein